MIVGHDILDINLIIKVLSDFRIAVRSGRKCIIREIFEGVVGIEANRDGLMSFAAFA